jgi:RNA polymerase sigma-70 factor (ECF subfamily)
MDVATPYARMFLAARSPARVETSEQLGSLEDTLSDILRAARAAWPTFEVPVERFLDRLGVLIGPQPETGVADQLQSLHTNDLYLATGCLAQHPAAFAAFEVAHFKQIEAIVRRFGSDDLRVDDVEQLVRERLFLVGTENPTLAKYRGHGALQVWFRVLVTRLVLNAATRGPRERPALHEDAALVDRVDSREGIELAHMRSLFDKEVREAMPEAFATLSVHERLLVRQRYLDDLSLEQLSALHDVHLATIKRRLAATREKLTRALRDRLMRRLDVSPNELTSILRLVESRFHITVRRLLGDPKT